MLLEVAKSVGLARLGALVLTNLTGRWRQASVGTRNCSLAVYTVRCYMSRSVIKVDII